MSLEFEVCVDHQVYKPLEGDLGFPSQLFFCLCRVSNQKIDLGGTQECWVNHDVIAPVVDPDPPEGEFNKLGHGVCFAGRDYVLHE